MIVNKTKHSRLKKTQKNNQEQTTQDKRQTQTDKQTEDLTGREALVLESVAHQLFSDEGVSEGHICNISEKNRETYHVKELGRIV